MFLKEIPLKAGLRFLPDGFHTELLVATVNHLLRGQGLEEALEYLEGKRICLAMNDTGNRFHVAVRKGRLVRSSPHMPWDVRISGKVEDFWRLANREEDPDTLFFHRSVTLEGDTEAALYIKNLLDAQEFDLDGHLRALAGPWATHLLRLLKKVRRMTPGRAAPEDGERARA